MKKELHNSPRRSNLGIFFRLLICILSVGFCLYSYIDKQNDLTRLRLEIPHMAKAVKDIREENTRLRYEIEQFENPQHLMELARRSEFSHLKQPLAKEVMAVRAGSALGTPENKADLSPTRPKVSLAVGAKQ